MTLGLQQLEEVQGRLRTDLEARGSLPVSTSLSVPLSGGLPPRQFDVQTAGHYMGTYLVNQKLVVMLKWNDKGVDESIIDEAFPVVFDALAAQVCSLVPELPREQLNLQLWDWAETICETD